MERDVWSLDRDCRISGHPVFYAAPSGLYFFDILYQGRCPWLYRCRPVGADFSGGVFLSFPITLPFNPRLYELLPLGLFFVFSISQRRRPGLYG